MKNEPLEFSNKSIGQKIKTHRRNLGISMGQLAEELNISQKTMSRIEKGETDLSISKLFELCKILGISPELILNDYFKNSSYSLKDWPKEALYEFEMLLEYIHFKYKL